MSHYLLKTATCIDFSDRLKHCHKLCACSANHTKCHLDLICLIYCSFAFRFCFLFFSTFSQLNKISIVTSVHLTPFAQDYVKCDFSPEKLILIIILTNNCPCGHYSLDLTCQIAAAIVLIIIEIHAAIIQYLSLNMPSICLRAEREID